MSAPPQQSICPLCRDAVPPSAFDDHLRLAHDLVSYRNVRRSSRETREAVLGDLLSSRPLPEAWQMLWRLAREAHGPAAEAAVADWLADGLDGDSASPALAALVTAPRLLAALAAHPKPVARSLALTAHLSSPGDAALPLLGDAALPERQRLDAAASLLGRMDPATVADALIAGLPRPQAIRLLRALEAIHAHPAVVAVRERLAHTAKLSCPRCGIQAKRPAMERHLWDEHRLVLDGLKTRDPWDVLSGWLDSFRDGAAEWLARCKVAAAKLDPENGPLRLARLIQRQGVRDDESLSTLLSMAGERQAACCPKCYAFVPVPREPPPPAVNLRPGRLSGLGYEVRVTTGTLRPRLLVRTPDAVVFDGVEPGKTLTPRGVGLAVAGPLVLLALLFACVLPAGPLTATVLLLLAALGWAAAARLFDRSRPPPDVVGYAWRLLVPRLTEKDSAFVAGLALLHGRVGVTGIDPEQVARLLRLTESATAKGAVPAGHFAALCRLWIELEARRGRDPVALSAEMMAKAFAGRLPFAFAQRLLEGWSATWWTATNLARLRVLLCDRAFEAGFEVQSLLDAGQTAPALGTVLGTSQPRSLAALRLLWSMRAAKPWDKLGDARTVFELAEDESLSGPLGARGDLLLYLRDDGRLVAEGDAAATAATVRLTTNGVWLQGVLFRLPPREIEIRTRRGGGEMRLGGETFRSPADLDPLSRQLERWFRFAFHDFLPGIDPALGWRSPDRAAILRAWGAVECGECGTALLPRVGTVGIAPER